MNKRPNVLLIIADQQRYDTINALGHDYMITPNLDSLVNEGCAYTNCYSHNPVCMPARHDLLVGMPASNHGYYANCKQTIDDYQAPTIPRVLGDTGYRTAAIGKSHFYPPREHHGYHHLSLCEELPVFLHEDDYTKYLSKNNQGHIQNIHGIRPLYYYTPQISNVDEEHYETNWVAKETIDWLEDNQDEPFMLTVGYIKPHPPFDIPPKYKNMYKDADLKASIPISRCELDNTVEGQWYGDDDSDEQKRKIKEGYLTCVSMVDESVGKILDYLRENDKLENTIIIYTADHGEMLQDKGYYAKELPYESSAKIPFIVRYPKRFKKGQKVESLTSLMDIFPTILDVTELNYPSDDYSLYGKSLLSEEGLNRNYVISASGFMGPKRWIMVRNDQYKYIYRYANGYEEIFDLKNDPMELNNILEDIKAEDIYSELRRTAIEYEKDHGPEGTIINDTFSIVKVEQLEDAAHAKYMPWSNYQFQEFSREDKTLKGEKFIKELQLALSDSDISGEGINGGLKDDKWISSFTEYFEEYSDFDKYKEVIGGKEND